MVVKRKKAGRTAGGVNKSELIREILSGVGGDVRNKDVIATLKVRKIVVSPAQVSNVKRAMAAKGGIKIRRRRVGSGRPAVKLNDNISLSSLVAAKKLAEAMGGLDRARLALDALAQLS